MRDETDRIAQAEPDSGGIRGPRATDRAGPPSLGQTRIDRGGSTVFDREQVWWIVPPGQRIRHAVTDRPGARPAGDVVPALCSAAVKIPYETYPPSREPRSRAITERCPECERQVADQLRRSADLVVSVWDS
ncbi:hypothetical protein [Saccharopolyspora taberi]